MSEELPSVTIEPLEERTRRWWDQPRFPPCGNWDALQPETQATIQLLYVAAVQIGRDEKAADLQRELEQERQALATAHQAIHDASSVLMLTAVAESLEEMRDLDLEATGILARVPLRGELLKPCVDVFDKSRMNETELAELIESRDQVRDNYQAACDVLALRTEELVREQQRSSALDELVADYESQWGDDYLAQKWELKERRAALKKKPDGEAAK